MSNFKIDDWIIINGSIEQILDIMDNDTTYPMIETKNDYVSSEVCEPWIPKKKITKLPIKKNKDNK